MINSLMWNIFIVCNKKNGINEPSNSIMYVTNELIVYNLRDL